MTEHKPSAPAFDTDRLLAWLDAQGLSTTTHRHAAVFRVEEGVKLKAALPVPTPRTCSSRTRRAGCG